MKNQQSQFVANSENTKNHIVGLINTANMRSKVDRSGSNRMLGKAMDELKNAKLTKEDRETCWQRWKSVKNELNKERQQEKEENYLKIKGRIIAMSNTAVYGDAKQALEEIKSIQRDLKNHPMDEVYWKEVKSSLATYWDKAKARLDEYYREKQRNWEVKHSQWRSKQESVLSKFESMISNSEAFISRRRREISKLESDMYGGSDSFRSRAAGWIADKEADIASAQSQISDLECKVSDIRNQLNK